jgi:hypothetical protein
VGQGGWGGPKGKPHTSRMSRNSTDAYFRPQGS